MPYSYQYVCCCGSTYNIYSCDYELLTFTSLRIIFMKEDVDHEGDGDIVVSVLNVGQS
jgi:hypothetical protein